MRPFPGKNLIEKRRIFNYRLCRARRVIENSFGILAARWRVLNNRMYCDPKNAEKIVLATVALHNFIKSDEENGALYCPPKFTDWEDENGEVRQGEWRYEVETPMSRFRIGANNSSRSVFALRDSLADYFIREGTVPFQWNMIQIPSH